MERKIFLAALAALTLGAGAACAQDNATDRPAQPSPGYDQSAPARDQAVPSQDADHNQKVKSERRRRRAQRRAARQEESGTPSRMEPSRAFPGDLPEKTTTPGSLDREGRVIQGNPAAPPPPSGAPGENDKGEYR